MDVYRVLRWMLFVLAAAAGVALLSSCNPPPTKKLVVTTTVDKADANVGDGICEATSGAGDCTLRAAIQEANASNIRVDITVPPLEFGLLFGTSDDDIAAIGDLDLAPVSGLIAIHAPLPGARVSINGSASLQDRIFEVHSGTVGISGIGSATSGTAFDVRAGATLNLGAVSAIANSAALNIGAGATAHLLDGTFLAPVTNSGTFDAKFSTLGQLQTAAGASSTVTASIVSGCSGPVTSGGYNLYWQSGGVASCPLAAAGDAGASSLGLAAPGPGNRTHLTGEAPLLGSPAFDAIPAGVGPCANAPTDEHGWARPTHGACDKGAIETQAPLALVVDNPLDGRDASPGDGTCRTASGSCTLRAAVDETNTFVDGWGSDTITLAVDPTLSIAGTGEDANASGDLDLLDDVILAGAGHRVSAAGLDRVVDVESGTALLDHLTISGGQVTTSGGGVLVGGNGRATISWSRITGNSAGQSGGGLASDSHVSIDHSSIDGNTALVGGGVSAEGGYGSFGSAVSYSVDVAQSTLSANQGSPAAAWAGGFGSSVTLRASTVVGNGSSELLRGAPVDLTTCGRFSACNLGGSVTLAGSAAKAGPGGTVCGLHATASVYSSIGDATCGVIAADPRLGPVGDNGGPTPTAMLYSGSPAIDRIPTGTAGVCDTSTPTDQRGASRPAGAGCDAGATEGSIPAPPGRSFLVTSPADKVDLVPGDGICDAGSGGCTLRAAIDEANASVVTADSITIKAGINPVLTRTGGPEDLNRKGDLDITGDVVLEGNGATLDAAQIDRAIDHRSGVLTIRNLTITGGKLTGDNLMGAGVRSTGALVLDRVTVGGNQITGNGIAGAGIMIQSGTLAVTNSTISGNSAGGFQSRGGGIYLMSATGTVTNTTFVDNTAFDGAAFDVSTGTDPSVPLPNPNLVVRLSTVSGNHGYGSVGGAAATSVSGSALSTPAGYVCTATIRSGGYNRASGDASFCGLTQPTDQIVSDLLLGPLATNGGSTQTLLPQVGSPVLDIIPIGTVGLCDATPPSDQRGVTRPQGTGCDAGAVEILASLPPESVTVNSASDKVDLAPGDGRCDAGGGECTLRAAIDEANFSLTYTNVVIIQPGINPRITRAGTTEDGNRTGDLDIRGYLEIDGNGATIDGGQLDRVIDNIGSSLTLSDLTITGGRLVGDNLSGGGVRSLGNLSLVSSTVAGNQLSGNGITGAGVSVRIGDLGVFNSTISGNVAGGYQSSGGAFYLVGGRANVINSTLADNTAFAGAAFELVGFLPPTGPGIPSEAIVRSSTVIGNHGYYAIGGGPSTTVSGSALATDAGTLCSGPIVSEGYDVTSGEAASCGLAQTTDATVASLLLGPLAVNGGPTQTFLPQAGSPLVDRIPVGTAFICDANLPTDQRGLVRPHGATCDVGSVER